MVNPLQIRGLSLFIGRDEAEMFLTQLEDLYVDKCQTNGYGRALIWYFYQVVAGIVPMFQLWRQERARGKNASTVRVPSPLVTRIVAGLRRPGLQVAFVAMVCVVFLSPLFIRYSRPGAHFDSGTQGRGASKLTNPEKLSTSAEAAGESEYRQPLSTYRRPPVLVPPPVFAPTPRNLELPSVSAPPPARIPDLAAPQFPEAPLQQAPPEIGPTTVAAAGEPVSADDDHFIALRENAERLKGVYEKVNTANMAEVDRLMKTRGCQINRIGGLLDRAILSVREWQQAETTYWAEVEQARGDGRRKNLLNNMESEQQRAGATIEAETANRDELLRRKANLEKFPKRTDEIIRDIDALILDIKDSEVRLGDAKKRYDDIAAKVANMNASITAPLIVAGMGPDKVKAFWLETIANYQKTRAEAQDICNAEDAGHLQR